MSDKKYFNELNIVRGIAVLLVAIGHSFPDLQTGMKYTVAVFIRNYIYDFHMAVFFFVSGFLCLVGIKKYTLIEEFQKKVQRIMIPYFSYSFISIILKLLFNKYANNKFQWNKVWKILLGDSPNSGLWFLWTLFIVWMFIDVLLRMNVQSGIILSAGIVLNLVQLYIGGGNLEYFMKFFVFFACGIVAYQNYDRISNFMSNKKNAILALVGLLIIFIFSLMQTLNIIGEEFYIITGMIGIFSTLQISMIISNGTSFFKKILDEYGNYSYDIYLIGYYPQMAVRTVLDRILSINYIVVCISMFIAGFYVALFIAKYFLRKTRVMKKIFLGM